MTSVNEDQPHRIAAIDALRGFALCGILLINVLAMGGPIGASEPESVKSLGDADWQVWWVSRVFVEGAMRGLFSLLFGASALLFLRQGDRAGAFLSRSWWLLLFGIVNSTLLLWPGDILIIYALAAPALLLFRNASLRSLFTAAACVFAVLALWAVSDSLTPALADDPIQSARAAALEGEARLGSYWNTLQFMTAKSAEWTFSLGTVWWVLDAFALMLVGMGVFRLGWLDGNAGVRIYQTLALIGLCIGVPLRAGQAWVDWSENTTLVPLAGATEQLARLIVTLGWLGAFMLAWRLAPWRAIFAPFSALGRMALTGYLSQSLITSFIFSGFGLALWGCLNWPTLWLLVPVVMVLIAVFSMLWLRRFDMGPVEWLWRALTFGKMPARG